jgi:hypothetical protein
MNKLFSLLSRIFLTAAFVLVGLAFWEKFSNFLGYTLLRFYEPTNLIPFIALSLLFVIALQLWAIKKTLINQTNPNHKENE